MPTETSRRVLDLRTGLELHEAGPARAVLFSSLARPGTAAIVAAGVDAAERDQVSTAAADVGGVVMAARDRPTASGGLERIAAYVADPERVPTAEEARASLEGVGLEPLLAEHRAAWAARWAEADVGIEGDDELQRAVRFALFHLLAAGPSDGEAAVGARGLAGDGYRGHVFWDTDVFVLPFLAATHPAAARAMLEYRLRRLAGRAQRRARAAGREGARFPWESARDRRATSRRRSARLATASSSRSSPGSSRSTSSPTSPGRPRCYMRLDRRRRVRRRARRATCSSRPPATGRRAFELDDGRHAPTSTA